MHTGAADGDTHEAAQAGESDDDDLTDQSESSSEDNNPYSALERQIGFSISENMLIPSFGTVREVRTVLDALRDVLTEVAARESEHDLRTTQFYISQFLQHIMAIPSLVSGEALKAYLKSVQESLELRASWPDRPLQDARLGTTMEGKQHLIFEHPSEGLIRLLWVNPLPKPSWMQRGGYQCDMCSNADVRMGFQYVTEDNARDHSNLMEQRSGYDVCAPCAVAHVKHRDERLQTWLSSLNCSHRARLQHFLRFPNFTSPVLHLRLRSKTLPSSAAELEVEVEGSGGLHVFVAVMRLPTSTPDTEGRQIIALPNNWYGSGCMMQENGICSGFFKPKAWGELSDCTICMDKLEDQTWIRGVPLQTRCGHYFHAMCLRRHLRSSHRNHQGDNGGNGEALGVCPNCRASAPLQGATNVGSSCILSWSLREDTTGEELAMDRDYRIVTVLCQDAEAPLESALALAQVVLSPADCPFGREVREP
eukprot:TRINITY_DN93795_c0_g1_i1.p1 TRINITY_DN93795_c0_g1~~TRINITY_DN93795_c0_g1_i1.p1  ORF type:complete len:479 (+),score=87.36 TRINITY_DN93795_c0_g1_i1:109-1545(+)